MYADIIVDISYDKLDKTFQYAIPAQLEGQINIGTRVFAPFGQGNRLISGYVVNITNEPSFDASRIKYIDSIDEHSVPAIERMIRLAFWMKHEFGSTMNQALKTVLPVKDKVKNIEKKSIVLNVDDAQLDRLADECHIADDIE